MFDARSYREADTLRDGTPVIVRSVNVNDKIGIATEFARLDPDSIYTRFFTFKKGLTDADLRQATEVDFDRVVALVVVTRLGGGERLIAGGRYYKDVAGPGGHTAEVAFLTVDDHHGRGLATLLLKHLARIAREQGVQSFEADVLAQNKAMLSVFEKCGLELLRRKEGNVVHITISLA